jgi:TonB-linked SusC/RagA family outer membrane protein
MVTQELIVGNQTSINVTMEPDVFGLEEVVVVGYGTQKKVDLTGSISTVKSEDIRTVPVIRLDQALQGRAAGVLLRQNSFDPGAGSISIIIRGLNSINGSNAPLFVIDGVINGNINALDPLDIQSIDVLKDASAASIYGSRAANGVVLVTTKRGVVGKAKVTFDAYYGISQNNRPYDVMNPQQYMEYVNDVRVQDGIALSYPDIPAVISEVGNGTDWQDELFGTGTQQKYYLSVAGGTEAITYSASGGYLSTTGLMPNVDYKKYTARFNVDFKATNYLKFFTSMNYANDVTNSMASTWNGGQGTISVIRTPPMLKPTDEFGEYPPLIYNNFETGTPSYYYNSFAALDREIRERLGSYLQLNVGAEVKFTDWLNYRVTLGLQPTVTESRYFRPGDIPEPQYFTLEPVASKSSSRSNNLLLENMLTFQKSFNDSHNVTVLAGTSSQKFRYESTSAGSANFVFEQFQFHNLGAGEQSNYSVGSSLVEQQLQAFFGRVNYNFRGKYLFQINGRYDGSSKFAPGNQWAFFPSASIGWRLSEEAFMNGNVFDNMKFRASYGSIGSHGINPYATKSLIGGTFRYGFNDVRVGTYKPNGIANKDLKWETTTQLDIGLDMGLIGHRLSITLDYYHKKTTDLLLNQLITLVNNPTTNHNPSITKNIGSLQNTGFEFSLGYRSITSSDFNWSIDLNGTFQQNKILDLALGEGQESLLLGDNLRRNYQILQEGQPFGDYVGYVTDGLYQNQGEIDGSAQPSAKPGDMKYVDQNNDGVINHDDFKVLGNAYPDFFGGITANLNYRSFNLSIFFFTMLGQEVFNFELAQWKYDLSSSQFNKFAEVATGRWTGEGTSNDIPRAGYKPVNITDGADGAIDRMVEDASFLKLRNLTLSYDLPKAFLSKIRMSNANVYIQGNNLLTLTKYSGFDPEANQMHGSTRVLPLNNSYYPSTRTFMIGLQIGL